MKKKVAIGLSGGVDSAVSAALLLEQGYEVTGVFLICYNGPGCRTDEDRKDALDVALKLKIPFEVLDYRHEYQEKVLEYFRSEYVAGRTPNPDVVCNREIKFGLFYDWALRRGYDFVATGHYARVRSTQVTSHQKPVTRYWLQMSKDKHKDQTYFLYQLREEQLKHILFPIGGMTKQEVRQKAKNLKLPVAAKPDSQGICFVGEVGVKEFLMKMGVLEKPGKVFRKLKTQNSKFKTKNQNQKIEEFVEIGEHRGVWFYTIGQRHGFEVKNKRPDVEPLFVIERDIKQNRLVVGAREECMRREFEVGDIHWIAEMLDPRSQMTDIKLRIRHQGQLISSRIERLESKILVRLNEPQFGVAAGQAAVFYNDDVCLGGGVIS